MGHCGGKDASEVSLTLHTHCICNVKPVTNWWETTLLMVLSEKQPWWHFDRLPWWAHPDDRLTLWQPTLMSPPWWETTLMTGRPDEPTLMSPPRWEHSGNTTLMTGCLDETTLVTGCPDKTTWWHAILRPPQWEATLIRPPWWDHPHDRQESKKIRYSKCRRRYKMY